MSTIRVPVKLVPRQAWMYLSSLRGTFSLALSVICLTCTASITFVLSTNPSAAGKHTLAACIGLRKSSARTSKATIRMNSHNALRIWTDTGRMSAAACVRHVTLHGGKCDSMELGNCMMLEVDTRNQANLDSLKVFEV